MARIRTIKPEFWTDGAMVQLSVWARLFYIGTWNFALCDRGHLPDDPMGLKLKILPADPVNPAELLGELVDAGRIQRRVTSGGRSYLLIRRFTEHQKLDQRWATKCPYCAEESEGETTPVEEPHPNSRESQGDSPTLPETQPRVVKDGTGLYGTGRDNADALAAKSRPQRNGTRLPANFAPTEAMLAWARQRVPLVDAERETEKFINFWQAKSGKDATKLDWPATWRNWLLNATARAPNGRASPNGHTLVDVGGLRVKPETAARIADRARFAAMDAAAEQLAIEGPT